jgi:hypothetical protein
MTAPDGCRYGTGHLNWRGLSITQAKVFRYHPNFASLSGIPAFLAFWRNCSAVNDPMQSIKSQTPMTVPERLGTKAIVS